MNIKKKNTTHVKVKQEHVENVWNRYEDLIKHYEVSLFQILYCETWSYTVTSSIDKIFH